MTLLPFGNSEMFLMYHVDHSVVARDEAELIDPAWLVKEHSPLRKIDVHERFKGKCVTRARALFASAR